MEGKIIKLISNDYTVLTEKGVVVCKSRGKFRNVGISPVVGDNVIIDEKNAYIMEVKPRRNYLVRPPISNIDYAIIVSSTKHPDFSTNLLDKLLTIIEFNNIEPIIIFTKLDLLSNNELENINKYITYYKKIGYKVFLNTEVEEIKKIFKNKISVLTGQSGAGKSTLLNKLNSNLNLKTDEISLALGRGKHTTRHVELIPLFEGFVADTPGFSSLEFYDMTNSDIRDNFIEFNEYREFCKYKDCMHYKEDECEIKNKVKEDIILKDRYDNYISFIEKR